MASSVVRYRKFGTILHRGVFGAWVSRVAAAGDSDTNEDRGIATRACRARGALLMLLSDTLAVNAAVGRDVEVWAATALDSLNARCAGTVSAPRA